MKNKISKISFYLTILVILTGLAVYYLIEQWYGFALVLFYGEFIAPIIVFLIFVKKIFFAKIEDDNFFYLSLGINILLIAWSIYANYHFYDNFNLINMG